MLFGTRSAEHTVAEARARFNHWDDIFLNLQTYSTRTSQDCWNTQARITGRLAELEFFDFDLAQPPNPQEIHSQ